MSLIFAYFFTCFVAATFALKYYDMYAAGAVVSIFIGALIGTIGSAIGHNITFNDFVRNVVLLGVIGALGGMASVKCFFLGVELFAFIVDRYIAFVQN